jgi:nucleoside-diphosphate-sugar epimerase
LRGRLLVTGARGFVGRHCLAPALAAGYEVWATRSTEGALDPELSGLPIAWRATDILAPGAIEALVEEIKPTHVLHLAWETTHGAYWTSPSNLDWLAMGARFVKAFATHGGRRFVAAGTCAEYDWTHGYMVEDVTPEAPSTFYGRIKLAHHHALTASGRQFGFTAATGRIFFAYGPHENPDRIVPYACRQLAAGDEASFGSGRLSRDFMHVEDVGRGFVALLDSDIEGACNVCSCQPVLLANLVEMLGRISGRPDLIRLGERADRPDDPPLLAGSNAKLRATGWAPAIALDDGLRGAYEWRRAQV